MRRLVAAVLVALSATLGAAQLVTDRAPAKDEVAGTWLCLSIRQTQSGYCLDDPLP